MKTNIIRIICCLIIIAGIVLLATSCSKDEYDPWANFVKMEMQDISLPNIDSTGALVVTEGKQGNISYFEVRGKSGNLICFEKCAPIVDGKRNYKLKFGKVPGTNINVLTVLSTPTYCSKVFYWEDYGALKQRDTEIKTQTMTADGAHTSFAEMKVYYYGADEKPSTIYLWSGDKNTDPDFYIFLSK